MAPRSGSFLVNVRLLGVIGGGTCLCIYFIFMDIMTPNCFRKPDYVSKRENGTNHSTYVHHTTRLDNNYTFPLDSANVIISKRDFEFCNKFGNNFVLQRNDVLRDGGWREKIKNNSRPFSLTMNDMMAHHDTPCTSLEKMLKAIKLGSRRWIHNPEIENATSEEKERHPSYFVPYQCDIPAMTTFEICETLSQFSHIFNVGDSLSRHMHQGIFIGMRSNYISGGIYSTNVPTYEHCKCDGQFSEHEICRKNDGLFQHAESSHQLGVCAHLKPFSISWSNDIPDIVKSNCESSDYYSPNVLLVQGGLHLRLDSSRTIKAFMNLFEDQQWIDCVKRGKAHVIWITVGAQSRNLDHKQPGQRRERAVVFNREMEEYFSSIEMNVTIIDFWNLTRDAQTSDGLHLLLEANMLKTFYVLQVLKTIATNMLPITTPMNVLSIDPLV